MSTTLNVRDIRIGDDVLGSDGHKVGTVANVYQQFVVVEKGFFFPTDYYIPYSAVASVTGDGVWLNVTKDDALHHGWDVIPDRLDAVVVQDEGVPATAGYTADDTLLETAVGGGPGVGVAGYEVAAEDELRIPVREEELTANVHRAEAGAARIEKRVITEDRVLEVPLTDEQVRVERRLVDRPTDASDADAFEEIVIEVPLSHETVDLQRQAHVAEEIVVSKEAVQHTEQVRGTVRREEVIVDGAVVSDPAVEADLR